MSKQTAVQEFHGNTMEHWRANAEEDYLTTPISVLKYITVLEEQAKATKKQHALEFLEEYDSYIFRGGSSSIEEFYDYIYG